MSSVEGVLMQRPRVQGPRITPHATSNKMREREAPGMSQTLDRRLKATWSGCRGSEVRVVSASRGRWKPRRSGASACQAPSLWVLLVGQYRTMEYTAANIRSMADASSNGCYMLAALVPSPTAPTTRLSLPTRCGQTGRRGARTMT